MLSPGVEPAEPLAEVLLLKRESSPVSERPAVGETVIPAGMALVRKFGHVVGVR